MKLTEAECQQINERAVKLMDELHEMTGSALVLLIERPQENGDHTIRMIRRGSPYASVRMAQIYAKTDDDENLANEIGKRIGGDDEAENWKQ